MEVIMRNTQQYQTKKEKQSTQGTPPVTPPNFCSCGYVLDLTDRFCPQCGKTNSASNSAFAFAPEEYKEINKQPEILSKSTAEEILKNNDDEIASSNVEAVLNKFEQHFLFVREKNLHQTAQAQIQNHFNFIKDKQYSQQDSEYLSQITRQIRASAIPSGFSFAETSSNIQQSENQLQQIMLQRQKENEALIKLEREAMSSEIAAMEAEKKKRELEELQRQIKLEEERKRLEKEKLLKSFTGLYTNAHNCPCGGYLHENLCIKIEHKDGILTGEKTYKWSPNCGFKGCLYAGTIYTAELDVKLSGNSIQLTETTFGFISNPHNLSPFDFKHNFEGTISSDGTLITGHWFDDTGNSDGYYDYFKFK